MKGLFDWFPCTCGAALVLLAVTLFLNSGCSDGSSETARLLPGGLTRTEYKALKKANKDSKKFKQALAKVELEKMVKASAVIDTQTTQKPKKAGRGGH